MQTRLKCVQSPRGTHALCSFKNLTVGSREGSRLRGEAGSSPVCRNVGDRGTVLLLWALEAKAGSMMVILARQNSAPPHRRKHF